MPWEEGARPLAIEMTEQGDGYGEAYMPPVLAGSDGGDGDDGYGGVPSEWQQQQQQPASWTPPVVDVGEVHAPTMGRGGGGYAPPASFQQQPTAAMLGDASGEIEAPAVTTVSATREPSRAGGAGADGAMAGGSDAGKSRERQRAEQGSGSKRRSGASLIPKARLPRGRQGCMTVPTSTPEPAVYTVDEEGVGSLPPTESFARGEKRHTDEPMVVTL